MVDGFDFSQCWVVMIELRNIFEAIDIAFTTMKK